MGNDIAKGLTFSGVSPNNQVTAPKLNSLVDDATIKETFYSSKTEITAAADADVFLVREAASGVYKKIQKSNFVSFNSTQTGFRYLKAFNTVGFEDTKIDVYAEEITMRSVAGNVRRVTAFTGTLDIAAYSAAPTANGRDFTPLTASVGRFCGIWAISDGSSDSLLLSLGATPQAAINLPTSYVYSCLLGVVWLNAAGTLIRFSQRGNEVSIACPSAAGTSSALLNPFIGANEFKGNSTTSGTGTVNATAGTWTAVNLQRCVPTLAVSCSGVIGSTQAATAATLAIGYGIAAKGAGTMAVPTATIGAQFGSLTNVAAGVAMYGFTVALPFRVGILDTAPQIIYAACTLNTDTHAMRVTGYTLNLGS